MGTNDAYMKYSIIYIFLYLLFFFTPMESVSIIQGGHFSLPKLSVVILLVAFIMSTYVRKLHYNHFLGVFSIYSIWAFITALFSINIEEAMLRWISFILPLLILMYVLNTLITNDRIIRNIMLSFITGCCIPICIMVYYMIEGVGGDIERMTALAHDQNELSVMLCIAVSFVFILLKQECSRLTTILLAIFVCLCLIAILLTASRTGFLILSVVSLLGLMSLGKKGVIWAIILVFILLPFILPFIPASNIERLLQTQEQLTEGDLTGRGYIWERGISAFNALPSIRRLIGIGYDQFALLYKQNYGILTAPHNTYLASYIEQGVIGLLIFLYLLFLTLNKTILLCRFNRTIVYLGMFLPLIFAMMTLGLQTRRWLWIVLFLIYKIYGFSQLKQTKIM